MILFYTKIHLFTSGFCKGLVNVSLFIEYVRARLDKSGPFIGRQWEWLIPNYIRRKEEYVPTMRVAAFHPELH